MFGSGGLFDLSFCVGIHPDADRVRGGFLLRVHHDKKIATLTNTDNNRIDIFLRRTLSSIRDKRTRQMDYFKHKEKLARVKTAEAQGQVADSMDVRLALIARMHAGELTLEQVQAELKRIKRGASKAGQTTRAKAYQRA